MAEIDEIRSEPDESDGVRAIPDIAAPDMSYLKKEFKQNISASKPEGAHPKEASTYAEDFMAGWGQSVTGLGISHHMPDTVLPEHADSLARIIAAGGSFAGDAPAMLAGFVGGSRVAGVKGGMAGAFALPAGIRQALIDHYQKGDIQDFQDFRERASSVLHETIKGAATGLAVSYAGPLAQKAVGLIGEAVPSLAKAAAAPLTKWAAMTAGEAATMTTVGAAMDGKVPKAQDFADNAMFMTLFHGGKMGLEGASNGIKSKMLNIYAKTGVEPHQVTDQAMQDPVLKQELMSADDTIPTAYKGAIDPKAEKETHVEINPNPEMSKTLPGMSPATEVEKPGKMMVQPLEAKKSEPAKELSQPVKDVLSTIGEEPEKQKEKLTFNEVYRQTIDANHPLKLMVEALSGKGSLGLKDDPLGLVRSLGSVNRKGDLILELGPRNAKTMERTGTPGLPEIWGKAEDLDEYRAYRKSKHSIDLENNGIESGLGATREEALSKATAVVKELGPKYEKIAKENVKFNNDNIDYAVDSDLIHPDLAKTIKEKWQNYTSMQRVMGEDAQSGSGGKSVNNPLKAIKGSDRATIDPLASDIKNTHKLIIMSERNKAALAFTDLIDKAIDGGDESYGKKAKTPVKGFELTAKETAKILEQQGFNKDEARNLGDVSTIFRADKVPLADDQVVSYKGGVRQVYEGVPKELVSIFRNMDPSTSSLVAKMVLGKPAQMVRAGQLNNPIFGIRHFIRQESMATALSPELHVPVYDTISALSKMVGPEFEKYIMRGGGGNSIPNIDNDYIKSKLFDVNAQTGFLDKSWNKTKNVFQMTKHAIEMTDEARSYSKYQKQVDAGVDPWQAIYNSRDSGIDVNRMGASPAIKAMAAFDPFQNAHAQGLDVTVRKTLENPGKALPMLLATITVPSVITWYLNQDKDWYKNLTPQDRDTNWHIAVGDPDKGGHIIRIPKPWEQGVVFGSLAERLLDGFFGENPHALKDFGKTLKDSVMPNFIPTALQPLLEQYSNKSYLTDSPLIPKNQEGMMNPEYQSKPYTSDAAKIIAGVVRYIPLDITQKGNNRMQSFGSPTVIDNYIKSWTGGVGQIVLNTLDKALESDKLGLGKSIADRMGIEYNHYKPEQMWSDNVFLRSFVMRYPTTNTKAIGDFFEKYRDVEAYQKDIQQRMKLGDVQGATKSMNAAMDNGAMMKLDGIKNAIVMQMDAIDKTTRLPDMDPHEKRQLIDRLAVGITSTANEGMKAFDEIEKATEEMKRARKYDGR